MSPTQPFWVSAIFNLFIIISATFAIRGIIKKQLLLSSVISLILIPILTFLTVFSSIGRGNQTEYEYLISSVAEYNNLVFGLSYDVIMGFSTIFNTTMLGWKYRYPVQDTVPS
ncbi:hypothetical protein [Halobacillus mangrovi]|uniref:Uncharacterized protein n=1 Tax=Halobacillus mangrovi TaxID=402384 RepID=A0A1W5ZX77_9BACI|nr:hypothetical protein [Halobacillus mangrovi]ARI77857.1 hypothetical protein HM131_13805 [Halobacillus mangrovi]